MKWLIEAIQKQLKCSEADARKLYEEIEECIGADIRFSEITNRELKTLINDFKYVLVAA